MRALTSVLVVGAVLALTSGVSYGSPGWVSVSGNLAIRPGVTYICEIGGYGPTEYDVLNVTGNVLVGGDCTLEVRLWGGFEPVLDSTFDIIRFGGELTGEFANYTLPTWGDGLSFDVIYGDTAVTLQATPEPATLTLLALGGLIALRRRRR